MADPGLVVLDTQSIHAAAGVPADTTGRDVRPAEVPAPIRIGYARCSTVDQEIASQIIALEKAGCSKIFQEKISTRVHRRPEMEAALALANAIKEAAPEQVVILTVHESKRLARNAAELMQLAADLEKAGIALELLTGPLTGIYDPNGVGAMFFAVLAVGAQLDRAYIRDKTLEGQQAAAARGTTAAGRRSSTTTP